MEQKISFVFADRNLDRNPAVKWGRTHEATAVRIYKKTMKKRGRDVVVMDCGIVIPAEYWLATSPDRRVFDPCEKETHMALLKSSAHIVFETKLRNSF